jgi:hypothetical protein
LNLSSENPVSKFAAFTCNLYRYAAALAPAGYWAAYANINRGLLYGEAAARRAVEDSPLVGAPVPAHVDSP